MSTFFIDINQSLNNEYIIIRALILFIVTILSFRFGNRRYNLNSNFDFLLVIILGGLISRGINGSSSLIVTLLCVFVLIFFHRVIAILTFYSPKIEHFLKGKPRLIIEDGKINYKQLARYHISESDLFSELRIHLHSSDLKQIKEAYLENSGRVSFILRNRSN